jgi:hypothetical protein
MKHIINLLAKAVGFTIIGKGSKKRHYTFTFSEAAEWAACYGRHGGASIYKGGLWVASRGKHTKPKVYKASRKAPTFDRAIQRSL